MEEGKQNFFEEDVTEQKTSASELDSELESEKTEPTRDAESEGENPASGEADSGIAEDDKEAKAQSRLRMIGRRLRRRHLLYLIRRQRGMRRREKPSLESTGNL